MATRNPVVDRALAALRTVSNPQGTPSVHPASAVVSGESRQAQVVGDTQAGSVTLELPSRRCRACNGWLFWVSVHGSVACSTCHPAASRVLVEAWHWLPEGEGKQTQ